MTLRIGGALNGGLPSRTRVCDTRGGGGRGAPLPQAQELRSGGLSCVSWSHGLLRRHTALLWSSARGMAHSGPTWSLLHRRLNTSARLVPSAESQQSGWVSDRDTRQMPGGAAGDLLQERGGGVSWWLALILHAPSPETAIQMSPHCPATLYGSTSVSATSGLA